MYIRKNQIPQNCKSIFIDGVFFRSLFSASIDTGISYRLFSQRLKKSKNAPIKIKNLQIVVFDWVLENPNFILDICKTSGGN